MEERKTIQAMSPRQQQAPTPASLELYIGRSLTEVHATVTMLVEECKAAQAAVQRLAAENKQLRADLEQEKHSSVESMPEGSK